MLTEKDYCDYDTCVALMELGYYYTSHYNWRSKDDYLPATAYWRADMIPMIHLYDAQKWLREEKKIEVNASFDKTDDGWIGFIQRLDYPDLYGTDVFSTVYNTYESALLVSIKEAIKFLKDES